MSDEQDKTEEDQLEDALEDHQAHNADAEDCHSQHRHTRGAHGGDGGQLGADRGLALACPTRLDVAVPVAAVTLRRVAIVARLKGRDAPIATWFPPAINA